MVLPATTWTDPAVHGPESPSVGGVVAPSDYLTTPELARALRLSEKSVRRYHRDGKIQPEYTTPGGQHRWNLENVLAQLRQFRPNAN